MAGRAVISGGEGLFGTRSAGADLPLSRVWLGGLTFSSTSVAAYCASAGLRSLRNAHT